MPVVLALRNPGLRDRAARLSGFHRSRGVVASSGEVDRLGCYLRQSRPGYGPGVQEECLHSCMSVPAPGDAGGAGAAQPRAARPPLGQDDPGPLRS